MHTQQAAGAFHFRHGFIVLAGLVAWMAHGTLSAGIAEDLRAFTGAPTRVVWIQDAGESACVYSERPTIRLMGFDTEDGKGERAILPAIGWYAKPLLTADGKRVVFADLADHTVKVVNFDGTGLREVLKNDEAYAYDPKPYIDDAVWTDPSSGVTWVYAMVMGQRAGQPVPTIRRYQIDNPKISELIWDKSPLFMFMPSGDGRMASGGIVDGGNSPEGVFTLPNGAFYGRHNGCWPSMSPDASHRMWVFSGDHRAILLSTPTNRSGSAVETRFSLNAPGMKIESGDEMYHPRWTNNVHFLTIDAPFPHKAWSFKSDAKIPPDVAANVEIYIGKFKDDFTGVERWVPVTNNKRGDYWPNVWIKPSKEDLAALSAAVAVPASPEETTPAILDTKGQVYLWQNGAAGNQINDPVTGAIHVCSGQFRDNARFARFNVMDLTDGAFVPDNASAGPLLAACKAGGKFALETDITPMGATPSDGRVIMAFADDMENGNFVLAQQGDALILRLKTDGAGTPAQTMRICSLVQNQPNHIVVSYAEGKLACYVNGRRTIIPHSLRGGLSNWTPQPLIFGDAWKGGRNWTGLMEDIGLFGREINTAEARQRFLKQRERTAGRKPAQTVVVDAKLIGRCSAADPKGIAPYRRCLSEQLYQIVRVISGTCADPKIIVAQWSVLDAQVVPSYEKMAAGQIYRLALEKMDDHPEQESERTMSGDFNANDLQLYYEVRSPGVIPIAPKTPQANDAGNASAPGTVTVTNPSPDDLTLRGTNRMAGHGMVAAATVSDGGFDYTQNPRVQFSGGGGQGAAGEAVMGVGSLDVTGLGGGYTSEPTVIVADPDVIGGRPATATAKIDKIGGTVSGLEIIDPGTGYLRVPHITITGGGGAGAEAQATLCLSGIVFTNGGGGYTSPPKITLGGGGGRQAEAQAALQSKTFRYTDPNGNALFTNAGTLEQDGSALVFEWAAASRPAGKCGFNNTGTWILRNSSCVQFTSSTGFPPVIRDANTNGGTLSVLDHSRLGFSRLQNSGVLELGAGATLGQSEYAGVENSLANTDNGVIKVMGGTRDQPVTFGYVGPGGTGKRTVENGSARGDSQAQIIIGNGKDTSTFAIVGGQVSVTNFAGSGITINPGAMLALLTNDSGSTLPTGNSLTRIAKLANSGDLLLAGQLRVQSNHAGFTGIENGGKLTIRGDQAVVERLPNSAGPGSLYETKYTAQILNRPGGLIQGIGTLTYTNNTGDKEGRFLRIFNLGTIAPGVRDGKGVETFGPLVLRNVNVRFGSATIPPRPQGTPAGAPLPKPVPVPSTQPNVLQIGIGGPPNAPGRYDTLTLAGADDCGQLELIKTGGNTLNIVTGAGFTPHGTYRIVTATSVAGTFDALQYNGAPQVPYTVNYRPDGIEVVFR